MGTKMTAATIVLMISPGMKARRPMVRVADREIGLWMMKSEIEIQVGNPNQVDRLPVRAGGQ